MKLSDAFPETTSIVRDGIFLSAGTLYSHHPSQIVYLTRKNDIPKILQNPSISCVIITPDLVSGIPENIGIATAEDPRHAFFILQSALSHDPQFALPPFANRISRSAKIHPSAKIAPNSVAVGKDVIIEKNVVIHEQSILDEGTIVRSNSIIGDDQYLSGALLGASGIRCSGGVHLHRETDIHANTRISRAFFKGYTEIGEQTKIDNLDAVGQGTIIGKRCLICAGVTIGELVRIGDDIWIGPNVTVESQVSVGNNVYITLGSTVRYDIEDDKVVKDNFAIDRKRFRKVMRGM
jgi:UDP-3-O-[3-hydroxymyristoyl] glucosamine N-acyltransferase